MPTDLDLLRDEFIALPRSLRRRISRDTARHYARPGDRNGKTADRIRPSKPKQFSGFMDAMAVGGNIPTSGQRRINAKRNARAKFWQDRRTDDVLDETSVLDAGRIERLLTLIC